MTASRLSGGATAQVALARTRSTGVAEIERAALPGAALIRVSDGSDVERKDRTQLDAKEGCQAVGYTVSPRAS